MRRKTLKTGLACLAGALMLAMSSGCIMEWYLMSHVGSFGAGWLLHDVAVSTSTETVCYRNGVLIDCADVAP